MTMRAARVGLLLVGVFLASAQAASAALLVEESFVYNQNTALNGLNGGTGWGGAWTSNYNDTSGDRCYQTMSSGNLANYTGLGNAGEHAKVLLAGNGNLRGYADRLLQTPITDDGGTYWWAFQVALYDAKNVGEWSLTQPGDPHTDNLILNEIFATGATLGAPTAFKFLGTTLFWGDAAYPPHLVLVKIQMSGDANKETLTAYLDPNLGADPATWTGTVGSAAYNSGFDGIRWASNRADTATNPKANIDEIRIATTWQDAVGAPEPATLALLGLGSLALLRRRARQ